MSEQTGDSHSQIQRYIRLTYLVPELLKMVDARQKTQVNDPLKVYTATEYLKAKQVTIDPKTQKEIERLSADLARFNEGASPSRRMARLVRALENVQGKGKVPADQLNELNRAALTYYNKREGMILSGPVTSNGKGRLETVGELSRITDELMKPVCSQMREDLLPKRPVL